MSHAPAAHGTAPRSRLLRAALRVPLFYKILIANSVIVVLGTVAGTAITRYELQSPMPGVSTAGLVTLLALVGVAVTVLVNAVILRVALTPLKLLEGAAAEVQAGNVDARVPPTALTDREMERLTVTFNGMLETLEAYRARLREMAARALDAEERERKRIAQELHDDTAQTLAALLIRLRVLRAAADPAAHAQVLEQFRTDLAEAIERIRRFARNLRPPALDDLGLPPALESHVRSLSETVGRPIRVETEAIGGLLGPHAELALYRIAQEALSNAVRHSGAEEIEVVLRRAGDEVELRVVDDGRGFEPQSLGRRDGGLGLFGMQERASYLGGRVEIRSRPGAGTEVRATVPIEDRVHIAGAPDAERPDAPRRHAGRGTH